MKNWVVIPLVTFLFSLSSSGAQERASKTQSFFITHAQFMNLTPSEQKTYVKKLREMVVEMSTTFPYFAEEMSARSSLFEQLWSLNSPIAFGANSVPDDDNYLELYATSSAEMAAKYSADIESARISDLSVAKKKELVEKYRQSLYWASAASGAAHKIRDPKKRAVTISEVAERSAKTVLNNETKISTIADESEYMEVRKRYLDRARQGNLPLTEGQFPANAFTSYGQKLKNSNVATHNSTEISATTVENTQSLAPNKKDPSASSNAPSKVPEGQLQVPVPPGKLPPSMSGGEPLINSYRCMYAGFVIKEDPCIAPRELPWSMEGLGENFTCAEGTVMCNPFMFGFKSETCGWNEAAEKGQTDKCWASAKPYCIKPGLYATKSCIDKSNTDDSLQAAVELIRRNETAFNELGLSFEDLCQHERINFNSYPRKRTAQNTERTKADIRRTCKVASGRMAEVAKRYGITKGPDLPPGPKGKELLQNKKNPTGKDLLMWKPEKKNDGAK